MSSAMDFVTPFESSVRGLLRPGVLATDSVLDHAAKAIEIEDIEVRVAALEEAAKDHPK
jgi:hypothetical protein